MKHRVSPSSCLRLSSAKGWHSSPPSSPAVPWTKSRRKCQRRGENRKRGQNTGIPSPNISDKTSGWVCIQVGEDKREKGLEISVVTALFPVCFSRGGVDVWTRGHVQALCCLESSIGWPRGWCALPLTSHERGSKGRATPTEKNHEVVV